MRLRDHATTVGILVALAGVSGYLWATRHQATESEIEGRKTNLLQVFRRDDLTDIKVEREGQAFSLTRQLGQPDAGMERLWHLEQNGKQDLADQHSVDQALTALEFASPERTIKPEEVDRKAFGLEQPRLAMTFSMGKLSSKLAVGGPAAKPEGAVYAEVDGRVMVVKKTAFSPVDLPADAFRTRTLVPYLSTNSRAISVTPPGAPSYTMSRGAGSTWKFDDGPMAGLRVDRLAFDKVLTSFAEMKADSFLDEAAAKKAQEGQPLVVLAMAPKEEGKPKGELVLGGACPDHPDQVVVIRRSPEPISACSARGVFDALGRPADALVDKRAFSLREDEVEEITIEQGGKKLELARKDKGWHQRQPVDADVALEAARQLLRTLVTARSVEPLEKSAQPLEGASKVTLKPVKEDGADRPDEVVEVGKEGKDGRVPLRRTQDGALLRIGRDEARAFLPRESALRSTKIIDEGLDKVKRLEIASAEVTQTIERGKEGSWSLVEPKGQPIDIGVAAELCEAMIHLTADQWVADQDDGSFGLSKPTLKLTLVTEQGDAGAKTYHVDLGESGPLGFYGRLEGTPGVFVVPRTLERQMTQWAVDRTVFIVDVAEVESMTVGKPGGKPITLVAQGEQYKVAPGGPELPQSRLDAFREALHDLRAEGVVHLGAARKDEGFDKPTLEIKVKRIPGREDRSKDVKIVIGASDAFRSSSVFYARREGIDATYALPAARVRALLALL